jgi:SRSO17 transposase
MRGGVRLAGDQRWARHQGWLVGERVTQGQPKERQYFWSHLPPNTPLEELAGLAHRRHAIEQFHEEAKGEVVWDQYQGRLWRGLHRHAVTVMLAYSLLVWLEQRHRHRHTRQGRRRDLFPSSAGSPAPNTAGRAVVGDDGSVHRALLTKILTE